MAQQTELERALDKLLVKKAPVLPATGKRFLVRHAPWLSLLAGILCLYSAWLLWYWVDQANRLADGINTLSTAYGGGVVPSQNLTFGTWLAIIILVIEAALYLMAYPGLRDRKKRGWDLVFYAILLSIGYSLVVLFTSYGTVLHAFSTLLSAGLALYFLFQVRSRYIHKVTADSTRPEPPRTRKP